MFNNVILYWSVLLAGFLVGTMFKKKRPGKPPSFFRILNPVQTVALAGLIFVLGAGIGADKQVMSSLSEIGFSATVIALAGLSGSIFLTWIGRKATGMDSEGFIVIGKTNPVAECESVIDAMDEVQVEAKIVAPTQMGGDQCD